MRVSREQVAENRRRILEAAARLFRERGFEQVTVAEVMKAAGLTHGGFYGHFASKEELITRTLEHLLTPKGQPDPQIADYAGYYLSPQHLENRAGGCPYAALGGEACRARLETRHVMTEGLARQLDRFTRTAPGETETDRRRSAIGSWAAMVGAVTLARLADDPKLADEVMRETRAWIEGGPSAPLRSGGAVSEAD